MDSQGFILKAFVTEADYQDRVVAQWLIKALATAFPRLTKIWADAAYHGQFVEQAATVGIKVEIVKRNSELSGFAVLPRRWVVERTWAIIVV